MEFQEGQTVGIDLGTTFSTLAQVDENGEPVAIPNDDDEVETASLILLAESGRVLVGPNRSRAAIENPENVVECIKRQMGVDEYERQFDGRIITPEFLSGLILKKLKQDAEKRIGPIGNAVITVPYYFNDSRRKATEDAGRIAGLHVIDIVNEPTAATLTFAWHRGELGRSGPGADKPKKVLVYDLGGGTFDVTVVQYTPTHFQVLATDGDVYLGGVDWNERLVERVCQEFKTKHGSDPRQSPQAWQMLRHECDEAKLALSDAAETSITFRYDGRAVTTSITRSQFERMTADLLQRTADTTELVLEQAGIAAADLDALVLVGGSTLMPQVPRMIERLTGLVPYDKLNRYTAVAQGAAIHAAILETKYRGESSELTEKVRKMLSGVRQDNVNAHGLGLVARHPRLGRNINHVMIPRNTRLPVEVRQGFKTTRDGQERVTVQVLEGDAPDPRACHLLGKCRIAGLRPGLPKGSPIEVTYAFDGSGRITVRARDKAGGEEAAIRIERHGGLSQGQVDLFRKLASDYKVE
jgi:molecular chaperone DnaK